MREEKFYLVVADEPRIIEEPDGSVAVAVEAYGDNDEDPVRLVLNLGDSSSDIQRFLAIIDSKVSALKEG